MTDIEYLQLYGGVDPVYLGSDPNPLSTFGSAYAAPDRAGIMPLSNLGLSRPVNYTPFKSIEDVAKLRTERGVHGRLSPEGGKVLYDHPALHDKIHSPAGDYRLPIKRGGEAFEQEGRNFLTATDRFYNRDSWNAPTSSVSSNFASTFPGRMSGTELAPSYAPPVTVPTGSSGLLSLDAAAGMPYSGEGVSETLAAETAADSASGFGGVEAYIANQALNMIPTRDKKKVIGEGSLSGITKGAGKGALTAFTLSGGNPYAATAGAVLGALGGTKGYFDSTTPPTISISGIRRGGGINRGLLGGALYG